MLLLLLLVLLLVLQLVLVLIKKRRGWDDMVIASSIGLQTILLHKYTLINIILLLLQLLLMLLMNMLWMPKASTAQLLSAPTEKITTVCVNDGSGGACVNH